MSYLGYRLALYLVFALAFINIAFLLYAHHFHWSRSGDITIYTLVVLTLWFGLWVHSRIARYAGGIIFLISAAAVVWPLASGTTPVFGTALLWMYSMGLLSLVLGCVLLFSRAFASEFERQRETQPPYKRHLRNGAIVILAIAIAIATYNDLVHLFFL